MKIKDSRRNLPSTFWGQNPLFPTSDFFDQFFDEFSRQFVSPFAVNGKPSVNLEPFSPRINVKETDLALTVTAELPGIDKNDVHIDLTKDALTIKGEKRSEKHEETKERVYQECSYGSFERRIPLHTEIDQEKVDAKFNNGVLTITAVKTPAAKNEKRQIHIKS